MLLLYWVLIWASNEWAHALSQLMLGSVLLFTRRNKKESPRFFLLRSVHSSLTIDCFRYSYSYSHTLFFYDGHWLLSNMLTMVLPLAFIGNTTQRICISNYKPRPKPRNMIVGRISIGMVCCVILIERVTCVSSCISFFFVGRISLSLFFSFTYTTTSTYGRTTY